jgi:N6-L-threonylcarbamoyladenine synthase
VTLAEAPERGGPPILAIESSCDETAAAVVTGTREIRSSIVHSQVAMHARFGGVVPELASRSHIMAIDPVVRAALSEAGIEASDLAAVVVTSGPGLVGALLVGVEYAKGIGLARQIPVVGVNHLRGHLTAAMGGVEPSFEPIEWPYVGLVVSGGHTSLVHSPSPREVVALGRTLDDAAGEAFDKVAKILGLPYPGGAIIDRLAESGNPAALAMPRPMLRQPGLDFSFSGLKTWVAQHVAKTGVPTGQELADLCASFREAVCDTLVTRGLRACKQTNTRRLVITGGVASNSRLRSMALERAGAANVAVTVPLRELCTDNAAMIGLCGYAEAFAKIGKGFAAADLDASPGWAPAHATPPARIHNPR